MKIGIKSIKFPKYDIRAVERAIRDTTQSIGKEISHEFDKTTSTWAGEKPSFKPSFFDKARDFIMRVMPGGNNEGVRKWVWLNHGTGEHLITGNPRLSFANSDPNIGGIAYRAKTIPGMLLARLAVPAEGPYHAPEEVLHPGIAPRKWAKAVLDKLKKSFVKKVQDSVKKIFKKFKR